MPMEKPNAPLSDETLTFIFNQIKAAPTEHHQIWTSLDSKVTSIFGVGSAVVGLGGFSVTRTTSTSAVIAALLAAALVAYAVAAVTALVCLWPASARHATYGDTLWPEAWNQPVREITHGLVQDITQGSKENKKALKRKAKTLRVVVASVGIETLLIGAAFIVRLVGG